ncbi:MAG: A24 family peptidase [Candidatus Brocadiaceae bacterium]
MEIIPFSFLLVILIIAVIHDVRFHKIPNWLTFPAMVLGLFYNVSVSGLRGSAFSLEGLFLGIALFMPFYIVAGMGAGDIKLMGAVGGLIGPKGVLMASFGTVIMGSVYALVLLAFHGYFKETVTRFWLMMKIFIVTRKFTYIPPEKGEKKPMLAYGVAIASGTLCSVFLFDIMKIKII